MQNDVVGMELARRLRAVTWGLAGAASVILTLVVCVLSANPFRDGRARPPASTSGAIDPEATAIEWVHRANGAIRRRRLGEAEDALERAKRLDPAFAPARLGLIWIHALRMRRAQALAEFAVLAELQPLDFDQTLLWCQIRCSTWDADKVLPQLRELLEADPSDRGVRLTLAEGCRMLGQQSEALEVLAALAESDADALAIRARLAIDRGDPSAAAAMLSLGPADHPDLAEVRGQLALMRHDGPAAVDWFRLALNGQPDHRGRLNGLAQSLRLSGQDLAAKPLLERVGLLDVLIGRVRGAAEMTRRDDPTLLRELGAACEGLGLSAEARAWYDLALARAPLDRETLVVVRRLRAARSPPTP
jgi:tetratricopeptide (TPR) repeat protein